VRARIFALSIALHPLDEISTKGLTMFLRQDN